MSFAWRDKGRVCICMYMQLFTGIDTAFQENLIRKQFLFNKEHLLWVYYSVNCVITEDIIM